MGGIPQNGAGGYSRSVTLYTDAYKHREQTESTFVLNRLLTLNGEQDGLF